MVTSPAEGNAQPVAERTDLLGAVRRLSPRSLVLLAAVAVYGLSLIAGAIALLAPEPAFPELSTIAYLSLAAFLATCSIASRSRRLYTLLLPIVCLAFPSVVDDFLPSVFLGPPEELGAAMFPFVTHIDIYLLLGILRFPQPPGSLPYRRRDVALFAGVAVVYLVISAFASRDEIALQLLAAGTYQIRYVLLAFLLWPRIREELDENLLVSAFLGCLAFLLLESAVFSTLIAKTGRLTSGTLGRNTFGNVCAAIIVYLVHCDKERLNKWLHYIAIPAGIALGVTIIVLTGTRIAIIAFPAAALTILALRPRWAEARLILWGAAVFGVVMAADPPTKSRVGSTVSVVQRMSEGELGQDAYSSPLRTRVHLFKTSARMVRAHPIVGVGVGRWNQVKGEYGLDKAVLLSAHNGPLAFVSQYGIPVGLFLIVFLLLHPAWVLLRTVRHTPALGPLALLAFTAAILVADLTNDSSFKHQVTAVLALIAVSVLDRSRTRTTGPA